MNIINATEALMAITDPTFCPILDRYIDLMDLATIYIIDSDDTLASIEQVRGRPFECWEFIHHHPGNFYEAVFIISDDGAGDVVLVPDRPGIDADLLTLCRANASAPDDY